MTFRALSLACLAACVSLSHARAENPLPPLDAAPTLFHDVHVIPMNAPGVLEHHAVLVMDGRIVQVAPAGAITLPADLPNLRTVECNGQAWLIPGLSDMHVHFPPYAPDAPDAAFRACSLLVANGVTTARGMAGHPSQLALRSHIVDGTLLGPTVHLAGPAIHQGVAKAPDEAAALVRSHHAMGFDLIKSHRVVLPEVYEAVQTTAAEVGIPVAGHVDNEVGLDVALKHPQQLEHLDAIPAALLTDPAEAENFGQIPPGPILDMLDRERLPALAERIAERPNWCAPTLALFAHILDTKPATAELMSRPEMRYITAPAVGQWGQQRNAMKFPPAWGFDYGERATRVRAEIAKALFDAGVPLMAGSDSPQAFLVTGFSLHAELEALVYAGLTPWQALECATANPARYFDTLPNKGSAAGIQPDFGTIEPGKRADLVLLSANPLDDISNTRAINAVMARGRLLDRTALDDLLDRVARSARPEAPAPDVE